jgi:hypothetical protein
VQALDHLAIDLHHAFVGVFRQFESGDHLARQRHFVRRRGENFVAWINLARMDQGLAVEAEIAGLLALLDKAFGIAEIVVDAVENAQAEGARRGDASHQPRQHRGAARNKARAGILGEIVGAHDEARQPGLGIERGAGDPAGIEYRQRRFHHRPDPHLWGGVQIDKARR